MSFPLYVFLIIYLFLLFIWGLFSLTGIYHMIRYGTAGIRTFFVTFVYIAGTIVLLSSSYNYISAIDWNTNISVFSGMLIFNQIPTIR